MSRAFVPPDNTTASHCRSRFRPCTGLRRCRSRQDDGYGPSYRPPSGRWLFCRPGRFWRRHSIAMPIGRLRLRWEDGRLVVMYRSRHCTPLGYSIVQLAIKRGYLPVYNLPATTRNPAAIERRLLEATLASARSERLAYAEQLQQTEPEDFLNFVRSCKGGLCYPDLRSLRLPRRRRRSARRVVPPPGQDHYIDLYRRFETIRQAEGLLTFDDMLMTGWEVLARP
jgi:hypothetical protein